MNNTLVQSKEYKGYTIEIHYDEDAESPREWDNFGRMVCWHSRYNLGDYDKTLRCCTDGEKFATGFKDPEDFREWWKENGKKGILLPLYLYDHSGLTISTDPFSCPWDSGQVGWIYATRDKILHEYGKWDNGRLVKPATRLTKSITEKAIKQLLQEVESYDLYLRGECYGYIVKNEEDDNIESCWGFIGDLDYCLKEAKSVVDHLVQVPQYSI